MTFLEGIEGLGEEGAQLGRQYLAPLLSQGVAEGMSGASMLSELRDAGQGIRTQSFYQLLGEVKGSLAKTAAWEGLSLETIPGEEVFQEWAGGAVDTYLYRVPMMYRTTEGGIMGVARKTINVLTHDPISIDEAISRATDTWSEGHEEGSDTGQEFLGAGMPTLYHQIGPQ